MKKIFKQLSLFFLKRIYKVKTKKAPQWLLVLEMNKPCWFYYPTNFIKALSDLTGRKIYREEINHYSLFFKEKDKFSAWCYFDKEFLFFAPIGDDKIYLATKNQYHHLLSRKGKFVITEDGDDKKLQRQLILEYKINCKGEPFPLETLIRNLQKNEIVHLASYHGEPLIDVRRDIKNWKSKNFALNILGHSG